VKAISVDSSVPRFDPPLSIVRKMLVTTPTILVKQVEAVGNDGLRAMFARSVQTTVGIMSWRAERA
jgi:hypothetical protein